MTIDEISSELPNGFHDAHLLRLDIDYVRGEVTFLMKIDLTLPYRQVEVSSRQGELKLTGLLYCAIEPPDYSLSKEYVFAEDYLWSAADSSDFGELKEQPKLPEPIPVSGFRHWFYDNKHNSFIYVAAMDAGFNWCD